MITEYTQILNKLDDIRPVDYSRDRNFIDGSVSKLSPYISRGVLSTKQVLDHLLNAGFEPKKIEKFIQELAWRDYWQLIWQNKDIDLDIKHLQTDVIQDGISECIVEAKTNIEALDASIKELYKTGYMHNHLRMYVASLATNIAKSQWKVPAQWMYYNLLDGDWASNALSWQWVCGANSNKKYIANQENINRYTYSAQSASFLDTSYENIMKMDPPSHLSKMSEEMRKTLLPVSDKLTIEEGKAVCIYNYYNLDPVWRKDLDSYRILLIEPSVFEKYPIGQKSMDFMISLSKNIKGIQLFVGEFEDLPLASSEVYFKEHPLNSKYKGTEDSRDWLSSVKGYHSSFFGFWKKVQKELF
jgi:deoxyribodipyrimidine photo-lyase